MSLHIRFRIRWKLTGLAVGMCNIALVLFSAGLGWAQQTTSGPANSSTVNTEMKALNIPGGALAVVRDGILLEEDLYGYADVEARKPVTRDTVFQLASVTKAFSAIALMKLDEKNRLRLSDSLSQYVPHLPERWRGVQLVELATHTSGLPDVISNANKPLTSVELNRSETQALKLAESKVVASSPGSAFAYDQTNYLLLKEVIEKVTGTDFRAHMASWLSPLGMTLTSWGDSRSTVMGRATMYTGIDGPIVKRDPTLFQYPAYLDAAAGLNSSISDMERFAKALTDGSILSAARLDRMWQPASDRSGHTIDISHEFGISGTLSPTVGWFLADNSGGLFPRAFMTGGSASVIIIYPRQRLCVVVLTNLQATDDPLSLAEGRAAHYIAGLKKVFD